MSPPHGNAALRFAPQARFWGKSETITSPKPVPTGWPKSDCRISKPEKYGASMAATRRRFDWNAIIGTTTPRRAFAPSVFSVDEI
jgi:hypothetical protein